MTKLLACLLFVLLLAAVDATRHFQTEDREHPRRRERGESTRFQDLSPGRPDEIYRSEGGRIQEWNPDNFRALCDADVGARKLTIEKNSLAVPSYKDSPMIKVITRGSAKVGIINPLSDKIIDRSTVFHVKKGDLIALPRGMASWIYNDADERTEVLEVADTTHSNQCGRFQVYLLAGGKQQRQTGGVLQGFTKDMLAHAFDVEERTVERVLQGEGEAIVKVDEKTRRAFSEMEPSSSNTMFVDFVYHMSQVEPDVRVRDAGELRLINSFKLPILKALDMGVACLKMEAGALTAPGWIHNAHKVIYVERGNGRIQVASKNGEQALDEEVNEDSLVVVPANYASAKRAGNQGFDYVSVFTSDKPVESYLAGRNSVYKGMPRPVITSGLQIDEETQQQLEDGRREDAYLFPPRKGQKPREGILETLVGGI